MSGIILGICQAMNKIAIQSNVVADFKSFRLSAVSGFDIILLRITAALSNLKTNLLARYKSVMYKIVQLKNTFRALLCLGVIINLF